ncbi:MAG: type IV secretion system protein TraC [Gammaproteobacteria bacterium]|nr:type IV secretion system protein TraC [Gammaproteobacteria bacterium]
MFSLLQSLKFVEPRKNHRALPFQQLVPFLPYTAFDPIHELYTLETLQAGKQEGLGFVLELRPQLGASIEMAQFMLNLFSFNCPKKTSLQIHLFASPIIHQDEPNDTASTKTHNPILTSLIEHRQIFYKKGAFSNLFDTINFRMRHYICLLSVVLPSKDPEDIALIRQAVLLRQHLISTLAQYGLFKETWQPHQLVNYLTLILNPHLNLTAPSNPKSYDEYAEIRNQLISTETICQENEQETLFYNQTHEIAVRALSVLHYPKLYGLNQMLELLGSSSSPSIAYPCPFLITVGIVLNNFDSDKNAILLRVARAQQSADSQLARLLPHLHDINEDWKIAQKAIQQGKGICQMYHQLLLFSPPHQIDHAENAAKAVWRSEGFDLVCDKKMQKQGILASLPMLLGPLLQNDLRVAKRIFTKTIFNAANLLPILAEWTGTPARNGQAHKTDFLTLFGRKGQKMNIDIFANPSGNFNGVVVGTSGSGKSFLLNELTQKTLATGGKVWIIDIGRSYEKLCHILGGQFIEFGANAHISLNPFSMVEDLEHDLELLKPLVMQMISPSRSLSDYETSQIEIHLRKVWQEKHQNATLDDLAESLLGLKDEPAQPIDGTYLKNDARVSDLGVQLFPFTSKGVYGRYFKNLVTIDFNAPLIVLELEELKAKKELQAVIVLILMYKITQEMYLADRNQAKLVIIDEAWDLMSMVNTSAFIEAGYRRARKYGGAFFTGTQSIDDYYQSASAKAALDNADWMFLLRQKPESIETLEKSGKFTFDGHTKSLIKSLTNLPGWYSEIFIRASDLPPTICRLFTDPISQLVASSNAQDFAEVKRLVSAGYSMLEAINLVLQQRIPKPS